MLTVTEVLRRARRALEKPVDPAGLAAMRVLFGLTMAIATARFVAKGWVYELLVAPPYHFTYMGFDWVKHDPIVERRRAPRHGDAIEGMTLEGTPLGPLIDDLAHAVLAHRRSGREMPEALRVFADFFGPVPSGSTPPPPPEV